MTPQQKHYFDSMIPGQTIIPSQVQDWNDLIAAGKQYINEGGMLTFNDEYTKVTKCRPIPQTNTIGYYFE